MFNNKFSNACQLNDIDKAETLLNQSYKIDIDKTNCHDKTPLFYALEKNSFQILQLLISKNVDLNKKSIVSVRKTSKGDFIKYFEPPLVTAARTADLRCIRLLLESGCSGDGRATVIEDAPRTKNDKYIKGEISAIHYAVSRNEPSMLRVLLQHGGEVQVTDHEGKTPIHYACICKKRSNDFCMKQVEILRLLLSHGGNAHDEDNVSVTPLALAINYECLPAIDCLLSTTFFLPYKLSMIGLATLKNNFDIVVKLIKSGFELNILNSRFQTPIQADIFHQHISKIANTLIFHGCDVNCFHRPLHVSSLLYQIISGPRLDCESLTYLLIKVGYDLNQDTWLLDNEIVLSNSSTNELLPVITSKDFFSADTLMKFGGFRKFSIPNGRMSVLKNYLLYQIRNVQRLTDLCRISIRRCLSIVNNGRSIVNDTNLLPLPSSLISFLLLSDVASELEDGSIEVFYNS